MCPKNDDPMTLNQNDRSLQITIRSLTKLAVPRMGLVGFKLYGQEVFLQLTGITTKSCAEDLSYHGPFGRVSCTIIYQNFRFRALITVTFHSWPLQPRENNLFSHNGTFKRTELTFTALQGLTFSTVDVTTNNLKGKLGSYLRV